MEPPLDPIPLHLPPSALSRIKLHHLRHNGLLPRRGACPSFTASDLVLRQPRLLPLFHGSPGVPNPGPMEPHDRFDRGISRRFSPGSGPSLGSAGVSDSFHRPDFPLWAGLFLLVGKNLNGHPLKMQVPVSSASSPIQLSGVSKRFLKNQWAHHLFRLAVDRRSANSDWFWALDNVNLTLSKAGGRVGIIGANGSGKTTLLRIISGVTTPTNGTVVIRGRVAPLLEPVLGTQPELTGLENIHFIGLTLGMRRSEIRAKLNPIVSLAGIKGFLNMQLKHYSLGMIMRLGFSVAIHVDADIILVDEAWSVGDAEFQTKSLEHLRYLHERKDTTIIVVSHELDIIRRQTDETLWLHEGKIACFGPSAQVVDRYLQAVYSGLIPNL